jgi:hypothetical protein
MRSLLPAMAALGLVAVACVAPIAYQDGLPAATPPSGAAAARLEYNRTYWWTDHYGPTEGEYFVAGFRVGQEARDLCFEEGGTLILGDMFMPCLQGGIGLRSPAVTLRALWTPLMANANRVTLRPLAWWQVSALVGTPARARGLGASVGGRTSRLGIGPLAVLDYAANGGAFRLEGSMTFPPPWAGDAVTGRVLTVGLSMEPSRDLRRK